MQFFGLDIYFSLHTLIIEERQWDEKYTFEIRFWRVLHSIKLHAIVKFTTVGNILNIFTLKRTKQRQRRGPLDQRWFWRYWFWLNRFFVTAQFLVLSMVSQGAARLLEAMLECSPILSNSHALTTQPPKVGRWSMNCLDWIKVRPSDTRY